MDYENYPHLRYDLPASFYNSVKPYLEDDKKIQTEDELVQVWQQAFDAAEKNPDDREAIAEWTMSIGSYTPYIHDGDIYEALHSGFGSLEVADNSTSKDAADHEWAQQKKLFKTLLSERDSK